MQSRSGQALRLCTGFEWDEANQAKIMRKHRLQPQDIEPVFFDPQVAVFEDVKHSDQEHRSVVLGKTRDGRLLFVVCTIRHHQIRVISARPAKKDKEVMLYEKAA